MLCFILTPSIRPSSDNIVIIVLGILFGVSSKAWSPRVPFPCPLRWRGKVVQLIPDGVPLISTIILEPARFPRVDVIGSSQGSAHVFTQEVVSWNDQLYSVSYVSDQLQDPMWSPGDSLGPSIHYIWSLGFSVPQNTANCSADCMEFRSRFNQAVPGS